MSSSLQYNEFGFEPEEQQNSQSQESNTDYQSLGFEPEPEKAGKLKSVMYGAIEGLLGLPALIQLGVNEWSKALESEGGEQIPFEKENPILSTLSKFPESETQTGRRLRTGTSGVLGGSVGGIPGIVAGLVGSQAGQTVREVYGKEGKFDNFGVGEIGAITTDLLAGGAAGLATSIARSGRAAGAATRFAPIIFEQGETGIERSAIKSAIQGEKIALNNIVEGFSNNQIQGFNDRISNISTNRYTDLADANLAGLQRETERLHRLNNLQIISPLDVTPDQGGTAIQQAANQTFQETVINAEREAYGNARNAAQGVEGLAPDTIDAATVLRDRLTATDPSPEQNPLIRWLNGLLTDLEIQNPEATTPASTLIGENGRPLVPSSTIPASTEPAIRSANDLIDIVQKGNQAVNYGSELREQSHRLIPIMNILRQEVQQVLSQNPQASNLYRQANLLHARNAETWGTNFMRSVRFTENPETIVTKASLASNMRNLKQAVPNTAIQGIAERMVVDKMTQSGSPATNLRSYGKIAPELSPAAREVATNLINAKDPLTTVGGRAQVRNQIVKDAAQAVNTGNRPNKIMTLMETPKGYGIVRESLTQTPQGREIFRSFERLFIEDLFHSITDSGGQIDFSKATNIFKNRETRQVTEMIGGRNLVNNFDYLQTFANNFQRNTALYSTPQTQGFFRSLFRSGRDASIMATLMHAVHVPWPIIVGLGLAKVGHTITKPIVSQLERVILGNPRALNILGSISRASTVEELSKQVPRLIEEIRKTSDAK